jgi:hypothetical protein
VPHLDLVVCCCLVWCAPPGGGAGKPEGTGCGSCCCYPPIAVAEAMRDYTGLDSLLPPIMCLSATIQVWSITPPLFVHQHS